MTETLHQAKGLNPEILLVAPTPRFRIRPLSEDVKYMTIFDSESTPT